MDHIYPTKDYKVFKIRDEVEKLSNSVLSQGHFTSFNDIASKVGITDEKLKEISLDLCNSYQDYGDEEPSEAEHPFESFSTTSLGLNCVKTLKELDFTFKESRARDQGRVNDKSDDVKIEPGDLEVLKHSIITLRFYEPFKYTPGMKNQPRFHQEYQVLGSNLLTELRDKFYCHCNYGPYFDISDNPYETHAQDQNEPNPGFFFIHDTFYNDTRNPENPDYSEVILDWLKRFNYVRDFKTANMQDTKFEDLIIRIGYPSVYQHHGACEHIFCITSVDLVDQHCSLEASDYPCLSSSSRKRSTLCDICGQTDAAFLVTNCALHVKDQVKVCENCFFSFHYNQDGVTKSCDFSAYRIYSVRPENRK
jgi:snRNA-activating protein complex subunit 3